MTTYREGSDREGWDFDNKSAAGKNFLKLKEERTFAGDDFYGLTNEEVGFYFINNEMMTALEFKDVFGHPPDMTP